MIHLCIKDIKIHVSEGISYVRLRLSITVCKKNFCFNFLINIRCMNATIGGKCHTCILLINSVDWLVSMLKVFM